MCLLHIAFKHLAHIHSMHKKANSVRHNVYALVLLATVCALSAGSAFGKSGFTCGSNVEQDVWSLWDKSVREFLNVSLLQGRLLGSGDVYALYDFQTFTHNAVSMARRCGRIERLSEIASMIGVAYGALEPGTPVSPGRRWVCRGGEFCNKENRLLNAEIMLDSVQFLGLASSVANALASSGVPLTKHDSLFVGETVDVIVEHLARWGSDSAIDTARGAMHGGPERVKDGSSELFFTDKPLWLITIYAELAGIMRAAGKNNVLVESIDRGKAARLRLHLRTLLEFFSSRLSFRRSASNRLPNKMLADVDRGYWRLFADGRYAGYEGKENPVVCKGQLDSAYARTPELRIPPDSVPQREDTGWDISHARRLVHALDALERNRKAMQSYFSLSEAGMPPINLGPAFANSLVAAVWNGDKEQPLFKNYLGGANGWYRVAYDNGTGECVEGSPPYGLSDAFPTGGYITWERYQPLIGDLGRRLYRLAKSGDPKVQSFMAVYYRGLSTRAGRQEGEISWFMFLPSLVQQFPKKSSPERL